MTALFEVRARLGGDPRGFDEFTLLHQELAKMHHPACPDMDWLRVEHLCLRLFERNGAELQTAVALVMARSYRMGLGGMSEGLALIAGLLDQWPKLWPAQVSVRLDLLSGLFAQLQPLLRIAQCGPASASELSHLATEAGRLEHQLMRLAAVNLAPLQALRRQVDGVLQRVSGVGAVTIAAQPWVNMGEPVAVAPAPAIPSYNTYAFIVEPKPRRRNVVLWLLVLVMGMALVGGIGWQLWLAEQPHYLSPPQPVQLGSLSVFDAGSAELRPESTQWLVNAWVDIKARPGWLIVIAGHTDGSGDVSSNLALSRARAVAVRDWIQAMGGLPDSCFAVQGFAASQPVTSNETQAGRASNRRVDIRLVPQARACTAISR